PDWMFDSVEPFDPGEAGIGGFAAEAPEGITLVLRGIGIGLLVAVVLAAPFINRRIVMRRREQQFTQDDTNAAAIAAWRYLNRLHRFRKSTPPSAGVEDIALKARYSQHSISEDERADIVRYAGEYAQKVYEYRNGPFSRFWVKYIRGM
ncbi:MAG: hypothetical protein FWB75_01650, partial [Oscillospiraceae bacterium]|nr:hypothetical protein [Oscillospiraceae bacterium]